MNLTNERRALCELRHQVSQFERLIMEALNNGCQFSADFGELYLTLARFKGQCEVLSCKLNALEQQ
jgi:hypothetical protein